MRAFQIDEPLAAAGLVLVLMNVATIVPLWPGNVGLVQIAVATPLVNYGIAYAHGIAFGIGLQAIEASVGIGIGLVFLAREGLSFATLQAHGRDRNEDTLETCAGGGARACSLSRRRLASRASSRPADGRRALAAGLRRVGVDAVEAPVADGGEGTAEVLHAALGGEWRTATVSDPLGRPVAARWLAAAGRHGGRRRRRRRSGCRCLAPTSATRCARRRAGSASCCSRCSTTQPRALLVGVGGTATVDGGAGMRAVVGALAARGAACASPCDVRNPLLGERGAARVFGPQKGADARRRSTSSSARLAALDELVPYRDLPGAGAGGGLGAALRRARRRARATARSSCSTRSASTSARAAPTSSSPARARSTRRRSRARRRARCVRRCAALGVRCELFGGVVRDGVDAHALSGDRGARRRRSRASSARS